MTMRTLAASTLMATLALAGQARADEEKPGAAMAQPSEGDSKPGTTLLSEPTKCYRLLSASGFTLSVGIVVEACGGSTDALKTVACFVEAFMHPNDGGLGLSAGLARDLCRAR